MGVFAGMKGEVIMYQGLRKFLKVELTNIAIGATIKALL
jgi:hypothetical protein